MLKCYEFSDLPLDQLIPAETLRPIYIGKTVSRRPSLQYGIICIFSRAPYFSNGTQYVNCCRIAPL